QTASVNPFSVFLYEENSIIECDIDYNKENSTLIMKPQMLLDYNKKYKILLSENVKDLAGNALPEKAYHFVTQLPPDKIAPYVMMTSPVENAVDVSIDSMITAKFSEKIDSGSLSGNFLLKDPEGEIPARMNYDEMTQKAILEPEHKLEFGTSYTAVISKDVKDLAGNTMEKDKVWNFKVEATPDTTPPTIVFYEPAAGRRDVSLDAKIRVKFSEPMLESTINEYAVLFSSGERKTLDGVINYVPNENMLEFYPNRQLEHDRTYFFVVNNVVKDKAGNNMKRAVNFHFRTKPAPDNERPKILSVYPQKNRKDIPVNSDIQIRFSERLDLESVNKFTTFLKEEKSGKILDIDVSYNEEDHTVILKPREPLDYFKRYLITVSRIVRDEAGNNLKSTRMSQFETEPAPDKDPPKIVASFPENNDINIEVKNSFHVQFSEKMLDDSIHIRNIYLKDQNDKVIECSLEYDETKNRVNIIPSYSLDYESYYSIIVNEVADISGNRIAQAQSITFKTVNLPDLEPPRVVRYNPTDLERTVSIQPKIVVYFSEPVKKDTLTDKNIMLEKYNEKVKIKTIYDIRESRLEITPENKLLYGTEYKVLISSAITDLSGNLLDRTYIWKFYTEPPPDRVKPQIVEVVPREDSKSNDPTTKISVQFSEKIIDKSVNRHTFWIEDETGDTLDFRIVYNGDQDRAMLVPEEPLRNGKYKVHATSGILDLAGNVLDNPSSWSFTVGDENLKKIPVVVVTSPENNEISVSPYSDLSATFNVAMDKNTINSYTFVVSDGVKQINGKYAYNEHLQRVIFHPDNMLEPNTVYTVSITPGIKSADGVGLKKEKIVMFKTMTK
ncbi:MAG: Ig-like domain-containing protein, partial [Candidatus Muiribacteriaceae bacterium]